MLMMEILHYTGVEPVYGRVDHRVSRDGVESHELQGDKRILVCGDMVGGLMGAVMARMAGEC
jgi:hypothetical protein